MDKTGSIGRTREDQQRQQGGFHARPPAGGAFIHALAADFHRGPRRCAATPCGIGDNPDPNHDGLVATRGRVAGASPREPLNWCKNRRDLELVCLARSIRRRKFSFSLSRDAKWRLTVSELDRFPPFRRITPVTNRALSEPDRGLPGQTRWSVAHRFWSGPDSGSCGSQTDTSVRGRHVHHAHGCLPHCG